MSRTVAACCIVLLTVFTSACAPAPLSQSQTPGQSILESTEPTASLRATHGDNFISWSIDTSASAQESINMTVVLRAPLGQGELAGRRPYADLVLLHSLYPKRTWYRIVYRVNGDDSMWCWSPDKLAQLQYWSRRRMLHPSSYVNGVDLNTLQSVAEGDKPPLALQAAL